MTFTPHRGTLKAKTTALLKVVQENTRVAFELVPEHAIFVDDKPEIIIEFPQQTQIQTLQCQIQNVSVSGSSSLIAEQCFRNQQSFQVKTFLAENFVPAAAG